MKINSGNITFTVVVLVCAVLFASVDARSEERQPIIVVNDLMCGLHRVQVNDWSGLMVDGQPYGDYKTSVLDHGTNYIHKFGDKAEVRVTQHNRIAFRLAGESRWAACVPIIFSEDKHYDR